MTPERTGHSRRLRLILKSRREEKGWSLQRCADAIRDELGIDRLSKEALRLWEKFDRHPPINTYAAWARVLDMKLVVEITPQELGRVVAVLSPASAEIARALDMASERQRMVVRTMLREMKILE